MGANDCEPSCEPHTNGHKHQYDGDYAVPVSMPVKNRSQPVVSGLEFRIVVEFLGSPGGSPVCVGRIGSLLASRGVAVDLALTIECLR